MEIDDKLVREIEQTIHKIKPLTQPRSSRRAFLGFALGSTGSALASSGGLSSANLGATSTAFAQLSTHLDDILQKAEREKHVRMVTGTCR